MDTITPPRDPRFRTPPPPIKDQSRVPLTIYPPTRPTAPGEHLPTVDHPAHSRGNFEDYP